MRRVLLLALLVAGCDEDVSGGLAFVPPDQVGAAYKSAVCDFDVRCGLFPDKQTCLAARLPASVELEPHVLAGIADGRIAYNGTFVSACFDPIADATCDRTDLRGRVASPACRHFTRGLVGAGNSCHFDEECVSSNCLGGTTDTTCQLGVCIGDVEPNIEPAAYNHPCNDVGGCVATTYCNVEQNLCLMLKSEGMPCALTSECSFGLGCAANICKPLPALGEPCPDHVCRDVGTRCTVDAVSPICVKLGLPGAACTVDGDCAPSYRCDPATSQCTELPRLGESCALINRCFDERALCDASGTCAIARPDGESCASPDECASGICDGTCEAPLICPPP